MGTGGDAVSEAGLLRAQLAASVRALSGQVERGGVWGEHSYARRAAAARAHWRLLAPAPPAPPPPVLDVVGEDAPPVVLPGDEPVDDDEFGNIDEERVLAAAGPAVDLVRTALEVLADLRLQCLAVRAGPVTRRRQIAAAARRLRVKWAGASAARVAAAAAALGAGGAWPAVLAELRARSKNMAAALPAHRPAPHPYRVLLDSGGVGYEKPGAWVAWVPGAGGGAADAAERRWRRALAQHVHVRALPAPAAPPLPGAAASSYALAARAALDEVLREAAAGEHPVLLVGLASGAALAVALAGGAGGVRGVIALAPAMLTAEGTRLDAADGLHALQVPLLAVCGERSAGWWRGAALQLLGGTTGRRLLAVAGADDLLRTRRLPSTALAAAVAEEAFRWITSTLSGEGSGTDSCATPTDDDCGNDDLLVSAEEEIEVEEYSHLIPSELSPPKPLAHADFTSNRTIEIVDGGVVTRVSGGTPISLGGGLSTPISGEKLAAADIMRMPVVLAPAPPSEDSAVTVTSRLRQPTSVPNTPNVTTSGGSSTSTSGGGALKYTRVVVGRGAGSRPLLLRRTVRLLPRAKVASPRAPRARLPTPRAP